METTFIFFVYLLLVNTVTFYMMGIDKKRAQNREYRIPERTLFMWSIAGGSVGSIMGMYFFRHKTRHVSFRVGLPLILVIQIYLFINYLLPFFAIP